MSRAAEAHVERGDRAAATPVAERALTMARALGSQWLVEEISGLVERARLSVATAPAPAAASGVEEASGSSDGTGNGAAGDGSVPTVEDPFGLTARERQVLALVAEGATNRQIGAALFMAEKTASVHVSRILGKLGVQSRTQAAAVAHRMHLE
jgi:DNA-binding NarL/FixJ family response regulator